MDTPDGEGGLAGVVNLATASVDVLTFGRRAQEPGIGFAFGGALEFGIPAGDGSILLSSTFLVTFLSTEVVAPGEGISEDGLAPFLSLPLTIGYGFAHW